MIRRGLFGVHLGGHAEAIRVGFDPAKLSYGDLLDIHFVTHDPTQLNRQGNDIGTQYRSAIFYYNEEQRRTAERSKNATEHSGTFRKPIVTEITAAAPFHRAEEYHQRYLEKRGLAHCHAA